MASPKAPAQQAIQLTDPNHVQEVFANNLAGIRISGDLCHITLSVVRPRHNAQGPTPSQDENAVSVRLVTPSSVMNAIGVALQQIATAQATAQAQSGGRPN